MGPNNTNNSSLKCDFHIINYEYYCQNLVLIVKKTPNLIKNLFLCSVSKPRVGPINSKHFTFKCGNIFAGICCLVLSLWVKYVSYCWEPKKFLRKVCSICFGDSFELFIIVGNVSSPQSGATTLSRTTLIITIICYYDEWN